MEPATVSAVGKEEHLEKLTGGNCAPVMGVDMVYGDLEQKCGRIITWDVLRRMGRISHTGCLLDRCESRLEKWICRVISIKAAQNPS